MLQLISLTIQPKTELTAFKSPQHALLELGIVHFVDKIVTGAQKIVMIVLYAQNIVEMNFQT